MKKGTTLMELLITLGTIGVLAAILTPMANKARPDETKTMYLKTYDTINQIVGDMTRNSTLYAPVFVYKEIISGVTTEYYYDCNDHSLFNTNKPVSDNFKDDKYQGNGKFCNLFTYALGKNDFECYTEYYTYNSSNFKNKFDSLSFTTPKGEKWFITTKRTFIKATATASGEFQTDIYVDVNPKNNNDTSANKNCLYDKDKCKKPDIFKFIVSSNGQVFAADPIGKKYIEIRENLTEASPIIESHIITTTLEDDKRKFSLDEIK